MDDGERRELAIAVGVEGHVVYLSPLCLRHVATELARSADSVADLLNAFEWALCGGIPYVMAACRAELHSRLVRAAVREEDADRDGPRGGVDAQCDAIVSRMRDTICTAMCLIASEVPPEVAGFGLDAGMIAVEVDCILHRLHWYLPSEMEASVAYLVNSYTQYVPSPHDFSADEFARAASYRTSSVTLPGERGTHRFEPIGEQFRLLLADLESLTRLATLRDSVLSLECDAPAGTSRGPDSLVVSCHGFRWDTSSVRVPGLPGVRQSTHAGGARVISTVTPHPSTLSDPTAAAAAVAAIISETRAMQIDDQTMSLSLMCVAPVRVWCDGAWETVHFADEIGTDGSAAGGLDASISTTARVTIAHFIPALVASGLFHSFQIFDLTGSFEFDLLHGYHQVRVEWS